jgi:hypothetical protein
MTLRNYPLICKGKLKQHIATKMPPKSRWRTIPLPYSLFGIAKKAFPAQTPHPICIARSPAQGRE